jgi:hypothetical protein
MTLSNLSEHKKGMTYTPTLIEGVNVADSSVIGNWKAIMAGTVVIVQGKLQVDPTSGSVATTMYFTIPFARSAFTSVNDATGIAVSDAGSLAIVTADVTGIAATGVLTMTGAALDTETVTIGSKVYTFQASLTDVDGNVLIGVDEDASMLNLVRAINLGAGSGSLYAASMTANTDISAAEGAGSTLDATSLAIATQLEMTFTSSGTAAENFDVQFAYDTE